MGAGHPRRSFLDLARQGNIGALREHAERLAALDPMRVAFAARMGRISTASR